jgi:hypothetical protein
MRVSVACCLALCLLGILDLVGLRGRACTRVLAWPCEGRRQELDGVFGVDPSRFCRLSTSKGPWADAMRDARFCRRVMFVVFLLALLALVLTVARADASSGGMYAYDAATGSAGGSAPHVEIEQCCLGVPGTARRVCCPVHTYDAPQLLRVSRSVVATNTGRSLSGRLVLEDTDMAISLARRATPEPGYFDVIGHGTPFDVSGLSPQQLAAHIRNTPSWGGQNVRLIACQTGCPVSTYSQTLANELGVAVKAANVDVFPQYSGKLKLGPGGSWFTYTPE